MLTSANLTYTAVLVAVFANQLCLPVPSVVFLLTAGAMSARAQMRPELVVLTSVLACVSADGLWFWFGHRWGSQTVPLLCGFTDDPRETSRRAHATLERVGVRLLIIGKFIPGLDGLLPPLAGAEGISPPLFLAWDAAGSLLWSTAYVGLGFLFARQLQTAISWASHFGTALAFGVATPVLLFTAWRAIVLIRMVRGLRFRRISPTKLFQKLQSKSRLAVLDLYHFEDNGEAELLDGIPGAIRTDPSKVRNSQPITMPDDVEIVLYSSAGHDLVAARAALALRRIGVQRVWVLDGGLRMWRKQGFPVSKSFELPETAAERLGIILPPV